MHGDLATDVVSLQKANAALIAAAPELLDALVELASIVEGVRNGEGAIDSFTLQPARAAIAAATGQVAGATKDVAPKENQTLTAPETATGKSNGARRGKSGEAPGKIAESRMLVPALCDEIERLRADQEQLQRDAEVVRDGHWDEVLAERDALCTELEKARAVIAAVRVSLDRCKTHHEENHLSECSCVQGAIRAPISIALAAYDAFVGGGK
jgi:hypothetical protein